MQLIMKTKTNLFCFLLQIFAFVDVAVDVLFFCDLLVTFTTARWIIDTAGHEHWKLVEDLSTLCQMYMMRCKVEVLKRQYET